MLRVFVMDLNVLGDGTSELVNFWRTGLLPMRRIIEDFLLLALISLALTASSDGLAMKREPSTLSRDISPPPSRKPSTRQDDRNDAGPTLAAIEAGQAEIRDHLEYFAKHLEAIRRPHPGPQLSIEDFRSLYKRNEHERGCHFVVHQHDHPVSGVHYDLRLQFSESSTVSFAVPYGLPGNPNSSRPNRMAVETRVHNLWVG